MDRPTLLPSLRAIPALAALLLLATALAGCGRPGGGGDGDGPTPDALGFDFEAGLGDWLRDADVPLDPNDPDPDARVGWSIYVADDGLGRGDSVRYTLDGRQDDGTVWIERNVHPGPGAYHVEVRLAAWSASESFNTLAHIVSYLGPDDPEDEGDFPEPGQDSARDGLGHGGLREPLDQQEGWRTYAYNWTTPPLDDGPLWLAVGVSVVWETEVRYWVDDVEVEFTPA